MPTTRFRPVRHWLKKQKAQIVNRNPFKIQLRYESTEYVQNLELTVDSGYLETVVALKSENREYFSAKFNSFTCEKEPHDAARMYRRNCRSSLI